AAADRVAPGSATAVRPTPETAPVEPESAVLLRYELRLEELQSAQLRKEVRRRAGSEIWVTRDGSLADGIAARLGALGYEPRFISCEDWRQLALPDSLGGLLLLAPPEATDDAWLKNAFRLVRHAGPALCSAAKNGGAVLLTVSRLDGAFGLEEPTGNPAAGGLAGLAKTAAQE